MESVIGVQEKAVASSYLKNGATPPPQSRLADHVTGTKCSLSAGAVHNHQAANKKQTSPAANLSSITPPRLENGSVGTTRRSPSAQSQTVASPPTQTKQVCWTTSLFLWQRSSVYLKCMFNAIVANASKLFIWQRVYTFGKGRSEGNMEMKSLVRVCPSSLSACCLVRDWTELGGPEVREIS